MSAKGGGVEKVSFTVGGESPAIEDIDKGQVEGNHDTEEKLTESEWVARWNSEVGDQISIFEEVLLAVATPESTRIILDSGATSTVVGRRWTQEFFKNKRKPPSPQAQNRFDSVTRQGTSVWDR